MQEILIVRPEIAVDDFLSVFVCGALVVVFGAAYVGVFTLVKMKKLKNYFMAVAYMFWALLTYCLYLLMNLIGSGLFTQKVLLMAMVLYLIFPHFVYFLMERTHRDI